MVKKKKEYYTLTEIGEMVDIKTRQLKYRMLKVKEKYKNDEKMLRRGKRSWNIHWSLIAEFDRVKLTNAEKEMKPSSLVTISLDGNYEVAYYLEVIKKISGGLKESLPIPIFINYFIEQGEMGDRYHIHFITNLSPDYSNLIKRLARFYTNANTQVDYVYERWQLLDYLKKDIRAQGTIIFD